MSSEPASDRRNGDASGPSPLATTQATGMSLLSALLLLLAAVFFLGAVLIWTLDEQPDPGQRGALMLGLGLVVLLLALVLRRRARRPIAAAPPSDANPASRNAWQRTGMGAPWTDWLGPLIPIVLIAPLALVIADPLDGELAAKFAVLIAFLELFILPLFLVARREPVALALVPDGIRVTRRNGVSIDIPRAALLRVDVRTRSVRGFAFDELVLHLDPRHRGPRKLTLREPMGAPIPSIAEALRNHLNYRIS